MDNALVFCAKGGSNSQNYISYNGFTNSFVNCRNEPVVLTGKCTFKLKIFNEFVQAKVNKAVIAEVQPMSGFETFCQKGNVGFLNYRQERG